MPTFTNQHSETPVLRPAPPGNPAPPGARPRSSGGREALLRTLVCLAPALVILLAGHQRRWMSDDGYIYLRTVRQIAAGNGPVFNVGERAEASTGTIWQWLLVPAALPGLDLAYVAVGLGLLLTAAGFAIAAFATARLHGGGRVLPLGALVLLAVPPVWDFATSGLETGLATFWLAGCWYLLVSRPGSAATAVVAGLGPLVRPDFGLVSVVFLAAQWLVARGTWRTAVARGAAAVALPLGYEVFRAGYYGHLIPLPAVTKEASRSLWDRGSVYLLDFTGTYLLWLPALVVLGAVLLSRGRLGGPQEPAPHTVPRAGRGTVPETARPWSRSVLRGRAARAFRPATERGRFLTTAFTPVVAGAAGWVFVVRVGGDFMHGRMLLPGLLLMLLPVFVVPVTRALGCAAVLVGLWAVVCAGWLRVPYQGQVGPAGIADERGVYATANGASHPVHHRSMSARYAGPYARTVRTADAELVTEGFRLAASGPGVTGVSEVLGFNGSVVPLSGAALDRIGLAYPLAAHSERIEGGRVGHDKRLPVEWVIAERGDPSAFRDGLPARVDPARVEAAARALRCGELAELRAATREPLTPGRFWNNLTGAWQRTEFRFANDPARAVKDLCGGSG